MKLSILIIALTFLLGEAEANTQLNFPCSIQTITVNGEMQTWQVCCNPGGGCQYTRIG